MELVIGDGSGCPLSVLHCNQTLKADTDYYIFVRAYTSSFYRNSRVIHFKTGRSTFFEPVNNLYTNSDVRKIRLCNQRQGPHVEY